MKILAIIPARGGSKGVPRKNLKPLAGRPMLGWTIEAAQDSSFVQRVVVSTDDAEIAEVARSFGAEVILRPEHISGDEASSEAALLHSLEHLCRTEGYQPDLLVFLQCTSPLTSGADIDGTVQELLEQGADSALAVTPFHYFLWKRDSVGEAVGVNHIATVRPLRQEREPQFQETGAVYVMRVPGFLESRFRFFGKTVCYEMPRERTWEVDDPVDLQVAEVLLRLRQQHRQLAALPAKISGVALDFDGVFTDNKVLVFEDGREAVICSRSDGWGLAELRAMGVPVVVLSTETNPVVAARCLKLGLPYSHGLADKQMALVDWAREGGIALSEVVFVGNDVNDLGCLQAVGCPVAVGDAHPEVLPHARILLTARGGEAALRELVELIKMKKGTSQDG